MLSTPLMTVRVDIPPAMFEWAARRARRDLDGLADSFARLPEWLAGEAQPTLKQLEKFAKATHNTWGLLTEAGPVKNDDGESGAGMVILRMLEREDLRDHLVVVTRWYGGKHLGGDRFRHVQEAVRIYLEDLRG